MEELVVIEVKARGKRKRPWVGGKLNKRGQGVKLSRKKVQNHTKLGAGIRSRSKGNCVDVAPVMIHGYYFFLSMKGRDRQFHLGLRCGDDPKVKCLHVSETTARGVLSLEV